MFFSAESGCIPIAYARDAAAARAMELSSWLNNGNNGTAYNFEGGSRVEASTMTS